MIKKKGIIIVMFIASLIFFIVVPLAVNYAFSQEAPVDLLVAQWEASDALDYITTTFSFLGTFFLGWVAWMQNTELQKIETDNYIAKNSCEVYMESIQLKNFNQNACNLDSEHMEPIVMEDDIQGSNYQSIQIKICLKRKSGYPTQVRVNSMYFFIDDELTTIPICTKRYDKKFSKIAISEKNNQFSMTVLLKPETKDMFLNQLNNYCKIQMDAEIELLSSNNVSTKVKCRARFKKMNSENLEQNKFELHGEDAMCFWEGNTVYSDKEVSARIQGRN